MKKVIIFLLILSLTGCSSTFFKNYIFDSEAADTPEGRAGRMALGQSLIQQGQSIQDRNAYQNQLVPVYPLMPPMR
jgi:hypothetical protein